ncbi:MAG: glutamate synthase subunit alpha, partial [Leifsonia flava]
MAVTPVFSRFSAVPARQGLYDPAAEKDACGLAMVATLRGTAGHDIIETALNALRNLEHRGAVGSDAGTGDGAGIITQIPDAFLRAVSGFTLPEVGRYAVGNAFLPTDPTGRSNVKRRLAQFAQEEGLVVLGWREIPVRPDEVGSLARAAMPAIQQLFLASAQTDENGDSLSGLALERQAYRLRKRVERDLEVYFASLSSRTLVYKGMVTTLQLEPFYPDLSDERFASKLALVHSRYSTNTFPAGPLAQPFRMIAHNGEINTVQGNRNWMRARQSQLESEVMGDLAPLLPIVTPGASDSASFDEVVELLNLAGRSLPHAMMMMVPEAYENQVDVDPARRAFYEYHSMLMEPWDGPAAIVFTDGSLARAAMPAIQQLFLASAQTDENGDSLSGLAL